MSTPSNSTKPSTTTTTTTDNVGKEQHDVPKSDESLQGSLDAKIASGDHLAATSDEFSDSANIVSDVDLSVSGPEILSPQGGEEADVWIPKGPDNSRPTGAPTQSQGPKRPPPKPKRGD